ncbi:WG repeat-containing protein [Hymenobacter tenuis]
MKLLFFALLLLATTIATAQQQPDEVWARFDKKVKESYRFGYKDAAGHVRIPARLGGFTNAQKFRHIIAADENELLKQYYLLKSGRQVGQDSVYMSSDYNFDCESEGKIRFRDRAKNRIGYFNSAGKAIIPAIYSYATPFYNGLSLALIGGRRKCWSGEKDTMQCEHPGWVGGRNVLINERNEVLIDTIPARQLDLINWYSLQINAPAIDTATTRTFRAVNGDRYTFTDYEKEFTHWFYGAFLPAVASGAANKVEPLCYSELAVSGKPFKGWPHFERAHFVQRFYQPVLLPKLRGLCYGAKNVLISSEDLNLFIFTSQRFQVFLTDCGAHFQEKYPAFNVVITEVDEAGQKHYDRQQHFAFIRTAEGYRLFSVSL